MIYPLDLKKDTSSIPGTEKEILQYKPVSLTLQVIHPLSDPLRNETYVTLVIIVIPINLN